jgi:hypothetical protein
MACMHVRQSAFKSIANYIAVLTDSLSHVLAACHPSTNFIRL